MDKPINHNVMKKELKPIGKFSLRKELSRSELKQVTGGTTLQQTYCTCADSPSGCTPFPVSQQPIGCAPAYCAAAGHGTFLYCA